MSANYTPNQNEYKNLTPFKSWLMLQINTWGQNNFPFVESDFDELTNYGMLMKMMKALNDVISNQNDVEEDMTNLFNAFTELQTYVDEQFDNLNIEDEVNAKLDAMAEDGTLETMIAHIVNVNEKLYYYVEDYGATGDGITDDSDAINQAFLDAKNNKGVVAFKTQNKYKIESPIYIPQGCSLEGNGCTIITTCDVGEYAIYVNSTAEDNNTEDVGQSFSILSHFRLETPFESFQLNRNGIHFACHGVVQYINFYKIDKCVRFSHPLYIDKFKIEFCNASTRPESTNYAFDLGNNGDAHEINNVQHTASSSDVNSQPKFIYIGSYILNSKMSNIVGNGIIDVYGECDISNIMLTYYGFLNILTSHKNVTINNLYASIDYLRNGRINSNGNHILNLNNCRFISNYVQTGEQNLNGFPITYTNTDHIYLNQCTIGSRVSSASSGYATSDIGEIYGNDLVNPTLKNENADYSTTHSTFTTNTNPSGTLNGTFTYSSYVMFDKTRLIGKTNVKTASASPSNKGVQLTNFSKNIPIYLERQATNNVKQSVYVYPTNNTCVDNGETLDAIPWSDDVLDTTLINSGFSKVIFNDKNVIAYADGNFSSPNGTWTKNDIIIAKDGIKKFDGTNWLSM